MCTITIEVFIPSVLNLTKCVPIRTSETAEAWNSQNGRLTGVQTILRKKTEGLERSSAYFGAGNGNATYDQTMRSSSQVSEEKN